MEDNESILETFEEHYTLNEIETQYISRLSIYKDEELLQSFQKAYFTAEFVVKISYHSPEFVKKCEHEVFEGFWADFLQIYGGSVVKQVSGSNLPENLSVFYRHKSKNFEKLRGLYNFSKSQEIRREQVKQIGNDNSALSVNELKYLNEALKFNSIHAFLVLSHFQKSETEAQIIEKVRKCKIFLKEYGSFAYMMLADAYIEFA